MITMTHDEFNQFCRSLNATTYVMQWGGSHVWKIGGKVFAIGTLNKSDQPAYTFKASELHYEILKDEPGYRPAPYLATRGMKWLQVDNVMPHSDIEYYLEQSYQIVASGLTKKLQRELGFTSDFPKTKV